MVSHFISLLGSLSMLNVVVGICIPGLPFKYNKYNKLMIYYCLVIQLMCLFQSICCILVIIDYKHAENIVHITSVLAVYIGSLFWSVSLLFKQKQLHYIINRINIVIETFHEDPSSEEFKDDLKKKFQTIKIIVIGMFISFTVLPLANNTQKLIRNWQLFGFDGVKTFNYQSAYDATTSPLYEVTILLQTACLFLASAAQCLFLHLFTTIFFVLSRAFKRIQNTITLSIFWQNKIRGFENLYNFGNGFRKTASKGNVYSKVISGHESMNSFTFLRQWAAVHQEILSISKDVIGLYSPLLAVYFLYLYVTLAFTIFSAIENAHSHTAVELIVLALFSSITLLNFFMLCSYGHDIMVESENVACGVYSAPWYKSSHSQKSIAKIILIRAQKPLTVNCFGSTSFDLTNSTFIVILKSIVSFYFTLVQMKRR